MRCVNLLVAFRKKKHTPALHNTFREKSSNRYCQLSFDPLIILKDVSWRKDMSMHSGCGFIFKVFANFSHFKITFKEEKHMLS